MYEEGSEDVGGGGEFWIYEGGGWGGDEVRVWRSVCMEEEGHGSMGEVREYKGL